MFCDTLYKNIDVMEQKCYEEYKRCIKYDKPFSGRLSLQKKLSLCKEYRKKITESSQKKQFNLDDDDFEYIIKNGYQQYFRVFETL